MSQKFINAFKLNPTQAVQNAAADLAQMVFNESTTGGATGSVSPLILKKFMAAVVLPLVNDIVLTHLTNQQGSNTGSGFVQHTITPFGQSQAKGNQLDFNRFKTVVPFVTNTYFNNTREFPYQDSNIEDWSLAGLTSFFNGFLSSVTKTIWAEIEKEIVVLAANNVPASNKTYVQVTGTDASQAYVTTLLGQIDQALVNVTTIGIIPSNTAPKPIETVIRNGLNPNDFIIVSSVQTFAIMSNTLKYKVYGADISAKEFFGGKEFDWKLINASGLYSGITVIKNPYLDAMKINFMLIPKAQYNPISFGFAYIKSVMDKVQGSATAYLTNTEYRMGAGIIKPLDGLLYASFNASANENVTGNISIGTQVSGSTPTVGINGTVKVGSALTDAVFTIQVYNSTTGATVGSAITVTPDADGNFSATTAALTANTQYIISLGVSSVLVPAINSSNVDSAYVKTAPVGI